MAYRELDDFVVRVDPSTDPRYDDDFDEPTPPRLSTSHDRRRARTALEDDERESASDEPSEEEKMENLSPMSKLKPDLSRKDRAKILVRDNWLVALLGMILYILVIALVAYKQLMFAAFIALAVTVAVVLMLFDDRLAPHLVMLIALALLLGFRVINANESLVGFSNSSVAAIAVLLSMTEAIQRSGVLVFLARYVLGTPKYYLLAQVRLLVPVAILSAFVNNTPVVGVFIPVVQTWSRQMSFHASQLLMPLSFASMLGGTCTIIGTSTNLIVIGLVQDAGLPISIGFFDIAYVGFPVLVAGLIYLFIFSRIILPARDDADSDSLDNARKYTHAVEVCKGSVVVGKNITQSGLRNLPGLFLYEIRRKSEIIPAPSPETVLFDGDVLYFTGLADGMEEVCKIGGLEPIEADQLGKVRGSSHQRIMVEVVIAGHSPIVGKTVKECRFRSRYNAAIVSASRHGERISTRIGDIRIRPGDTLLLETNEMFLKYHRHDHNFALVGQIVGGSVKPKKDYLNMAYVVLVAAIAIAASQVTVPADWVGDPPTVDGTYVKIWSLWGTALAATILYILTKRMTLDQALAAMKPNLLIIIAAAFGVGVALDKTGAATAISDVILFFFSKAGSPGVLGGLFIMTAVMSAVISNAATVTIMFPIALNFIKSGTISIRSTVYTLMMAASAAFATPIGYQTNLMVVGPGRYTFSDFLKFGLPLTVLDGVITVAICYFFFETGGSSE